MGGRLPQHRRCLKGKKRFVLGASGHIAGVINPPPKKQAQPLDRQRATALPARPDAWLARREGAPGQLVDRLVRLARGHSAASRSPRRRRPATRKYKAIEPAPGRYVKAEGLSRASPRRLRSDHSSTGDFHDTDIVIVAAARTAVGKFGGTLAKIPAPELGAAVIADLLERAKLDRRPDRRSHPRPGAHRRLGPEPGAPGA